MLSSSVPLPLLSLSTPSLSPCGGGVGMMRKRGMVGWRGWMVTMMTAQGDRGVTTNRSTISIGLHIIVVASRSEKRRHLDNNRDDDDGGDGPGHRASMLRRSFWFVVGTTTTTTTTTMAVDRRRGCSGGRLGRRRETTTSSSSSMEQRCASSFSQSSFAHQRTRRRHCRGSRHRHGGSVGFNAATAGPT